MLLLLLCTCGPALMNAQRTAADQTSPEQQAAKEALQAAREITYDFPSIRPLTIEYQQSLGRDYTAEIGGDEFQTGEIGNQRRMTVGLNLPVYYSKKFIVATALKYTFDETEFRELNRRGSERMESDVYNFNAYSAGLNGIFNTALWGKPLSINGGLILDGGNEGIERLKGLAGATMTLKRTESTSVAVGLIAIIDPTSQIPFLPIFRYKHQFKNSPYTFDFVLPSRVLLRRAVGKRGRISAGTTFGGSGYYVAVDQPGFAQDFEYSQLEVNTGLIYEHKLTEAVIFTVRGGLTNFLSNRLTEKGEPNKDYVYRNTQGSTGYFSVGVSYNPFTRR